MPAWKEATLIVYDKGNNYQQYENKINKSTAEKGEEKKREKETKTDKKEREGEGAWKKSNKRQNRIHQERQRPRAEIEFWTEKGGK